MKFLKIYNILNATLSFNSQILFVNFLRKVYFKNSLSKIKAKYRFKANVFTLIKNNLASKKLMN